jgi:hypothetical protein
MLTEKEKGRFEEYETRRKEIMRWYISYLTSWSKTKIHLKSLKEEFKDVIDKLPYRGKGLDKKELED